MLQYGLLFNSGSLLITPILFYKKFGIHSSGKHSYFFQQVLVDKKLSSFFLCNFYTNFFSCPVPTYRYNHGSLAAQDEFYLSYALPLIMFVTVFH